MAPDFIETAKLQDNAINYAGIRAPVDPPAVTEVSLPLSDANLQKVRAAMVDEHAALKNEALDLARNWTPNSDWQADTTSRGGVYFHGHFKMITMFVELEKGKPPSFSTEID